MPQGVERYRRYNHARDKNMRILHRLELPPVDPGRIDVRPGVTHACVIVLCSSAAIANRLASRRTPETLSSRSHRGDWHQRRRK